jgi:hypothetical protein
MIVWDYPSAEICGAVHRLNHAQRYASFLETVREWKAHWRQPRQETLTPVSSRPRRGLGRNDLPLIVATRDSRGLLPSFLTHYRGLGVTRFLVVDEHSSDGSRDLLLEQPDVELYSPSLNYADALRGKLWREAIVRLYGRNRWYVNVDVDEFLVYDRYRSRALPEVVARLNQLGLKRLAAPMIDLYPTGAIESAAIPESAERMPWQAAPMFDADGYSFEVGLRSMRIRGGVIRRAFAGDLELVKFPVVYWDALTVLARSIHYPLPYWRNFGMIGGALLHFRFVAGFKKRTFEAVATGQYAGQSRFYRDVLKSGVDISNASLCGPQSIRYEGDRQLSELGFFAPIFDG